MAKAKKQAVAAKVTYNGDLDAIDYLGYRMKRGEAVEVDADTAKFLQGNDYFDVEGVDADDPASNVAPEDALAAERAAHQAEIDKLNAEHADALSKQAEALKAGWQEQHDALVAENEQLKAQIAGAQQEPPKQEETKQAEQG